MLPGVQTVVHRDTDTQMFNCPCGDIEHARYSYHIFAHIVNKIPHPVGRVSDYVDIAAETPVQQQSIPFMPSSSMISNQSPPMVQHDPSLKTETTPLLDIEECAMDVDICAQTFIDGQEPLVSNEHSSPANPGDTIPIESPSTPVKIIEFVLL